VLAPAGPTPAIGEGASALPPLTVCANMKITEDLEMLVDEFLAHIADK